MAPRAWVEYASEEQAGIGCGACAASPRCSAQRRPTDPLGALVAPPVGRNRRVSSNELPSGMTQPDMTVLPPGRSIEMPLLEGPGVITHLWFTSHAGRVNELNALSLRIYWDGRTNRGGSAARDFFAVGQGKPRRSRAFPCRCRRRVRSPATGGCPSPSRPASWWPMTTRTGPPTLLAGGLDRTGRLAGGHGYFHARYRQPIRRCSQDYLIADLQGRGHYVGTVMSVTLARMAVGEAMTSST